MTKTTKVNCDCGDTGLLKVWHWSELDWKNEVCPCGQDPICMMCDGQSGLDSDGTGVCPVCRGYGLNLKVLRERGKLLFRPEYLRGEKSFQGRPRIFVTVPDNDTGRNWGRWIYADQPADAIMYEIGGMSNDADSGDAAIVDYQHFGSLQIRPDDSIEFVAEVVPLMAKHGEVFARLVNRYGGLGHVRKAKVAMEYGYRGEFNDVVDFARHLVHLFYGDMRKSLPGLSLDRINYERIAIDLLTNGDVFALTVDRRVHVFDAA